MWYVLGALGLLILFIVVRAAVVFHRGNSIIRAILSTVATNKVEAVFVDWLREDPRRIEQKDIFVQVMVSLGLSQANCANLVMSCMTAAWKPDAKPFGELLVTEMDRHLTFDDLGDDPHKDAKRKAGIDAMNSVRAKLLALDAW